MGEHARDPPRAILFLNLLQFNSAEKKTTLNKCKIWFPRKNSVYASETFF